HVINPCPPPPATHHRTNGADQHSIHIKQKAFCFNTNWLAQTALSCNTNFCAASNIFVTDSTEQLSQYTRNNGSVPDARNSNQVSAAFGLPVQSWFSRKNLIPSIVSTRSTFMPAISVTPV